MFGGRGEGQAREGKKREKPPGAGPGPVPSPGGRQEGRRAGRDRPCRSFPGAAVPPLPQPPHRPVGPARPFPYGACSRRGCEGSSPAAPPATPYRQQIATANKAEIPGAGFSAGIKAPSGACSNRSGWDVRCPRLRRHLRLSPCPLARLLLGFVCAGQSQGREEEKSFPRPVGAAAFGGGWILAKFTFRCVFHS